MKFIPSQIIEKLRAKRKNFRISKYINAKLYGVVGFSNFGLVESYQNESSSDLLFLFLVFFVVVIVLIALYNQYIKTSSSETKLEQQRKELEELNKVLEMRNIKLGELYDTQNKMKSIMTHDLKNSFNTLIGMSDLLLGDYSEMSDDEKLDVVRLFQSTAKSSNLLLDNLLQWTLLQQTKIEPNYTAINAKDSIEKVVANYLGVAVNKKISVEVKCSDSIELYTDLDIFKTILRNIVYNALKYTSASGSVEIGVKEAGNKYAELYIKDTGVGMDEQTILELSKAKMVSSSEGTGNEKGAGFGLIICRELLELLNSSLEIRSVKGEGSTFSFLLPKL